MATQKKGSPTFKPMKARKRRRRRKPRATVERIHFQCPECEGTELISEYSRCSIQLQVFIVEKLLGRHPTAVEETAPWEHQDGGYEGYGCGECEFTLKTPDGSRVKTAGQLRKWLRQRKMLGEAEECVR